MKFISILLLMTASVFGQVTAPVAPAQIQNVSWFGEAGAAPGNNVQAGLGVAFAVANNQAVFVELADQTGAGVAQSMQVMFGIKSNFPGVTVSGRKLVPFGIVAYGASIQSLATQKTAAAVLGGITSNTVTTVATSAGLAQQYAFGFQTKLGGFNVGLAGSGSKTPGRWGAYPLVFISREFGKGN